MQATTRLSSSSPHPLQSSGAQVLRPTTRKGLAPSIHDGCACSLQNRWRRKGGYFGNKGSLVIAKVNALQGRSVQSPSSPLNRWALGKGLSACGGAFQRQDSRLKERASVVPRASENDKAEANEVLSGEVTASRHMSPSALFSQFPAGDLPLLGSNW
jgi:hypothetical protein